MSLRPYPEPHAEIVEKITPHRMLANRSDRTKAVWYSYRVRLEVGDDFVPCFWCGKPLARMLMTVEHVIPRARKGPHELWNLRPACKPCNNRRGRKYRPEEDELIIPPLSRYWRRPVPPKDLIE